MTAREKPLHLQMVAFCRYHLGKYCFAPFTGQDYPAWNAFIYLLQCYSHGGGAPALAALKSTLACAQHTAVVLAPFVQVIPGVMDWGDVARLWPTIADGITFTGKGPNGITDVRHLYATQRSEVYRGQSNKVEETRTTHGWWPQPAAAGGSR